MRLVHAKSPCCRARVVRFGSRRRQCVQCKKTWRIRSKKRGRKPVRVHPNVEKIAFASFESLRHQAKRLKKGRELVRRRHSQVMDKLIKKLPSPQAPPGPLIAIIDGWIWFFDQRAYTLYLILLRSTHSTRAILTQPVILAGHENINGWKEAFSTLDPAIIESIRAVVSDGVTGFHIYARERNWVLQRCHIHLIRTLYPLLGKRNSTAKHKKLREKMYQCVLEILKTPNQARAELLVLQLSKMANYSYCPKWFGLRTRGFLEQYQDFRSYLKYPELNLPKTTNSAESVFRLLSDTLRQTRGFRNPQAMIKWVTLQFKIIKSIKCNGLIYQPN